MEELKKRAAVKARIKNLELGFCYYSEDPNDYIFDGIQRGFNGFPDTACMLDVGSLSHFNIEMEDRYEK